MRLTYILAVVVAATLHTSATAFSPVQDSKAATENGAVATVVDSVEGGRLLRRVNNDYDDLDDDLDDLDDLDEGDDDSFDEERGLAHVLKKVDPFKTWKKSMEAMKKSTAAV